MPDIYIIGGPNGAGKTTAAKTILPGILNVVEFVNADEIAKGLSPFNPEGVAFEAGRIMLGRVNQLIDQQKDFALETTLSTRSYLKLVDKAVEKGYAVILIFLWLESVDAARQRVAKRVQEGGHNIPYDVIERRYNRGIKNLPLFMEKVTNWYLYDNSEGEYKSIAKFVANDKIIDNFSIWGKIIG